MGVLNNSMWNVSGASDFYEHQIAKSFRWDSGYLKWTPGSAGNRQVWTFSCWVKKTIFPGDTDVMLLNAGTSGAQSSRFRAYWYGDLLRSSSADANYNISTAVYRDPSAWMHIVWKLTGGTSYQYVNGVEVSTSSVSGDVAINNNVEHTLGVKGDYDTGTRFKGCIAEVVFIDGTAHDPDDFAETKNGVWVPKDPSGLTFGSQGYYLDFADASAPGNDVSGNNNDWTNVNLATHDQMTDTPTFNSSSNGGNFPIINVLDPTVDKSAISECNLKITEGNQRGGKATFAVPLTGKWYWEAYCYADSNQEMWNGITGITANSSGDGRGGSSNSNTYGASWSQYSGSNYFIRKYIAGTESSVSTSFGTTKHTILGIAVNRDDNEIKFYKDNALQITNAISATQEYFPAGGMGGGTNATTIQVWNFGQDGTFAGEKTAQGNADGNGFGNFYYSPPTGHLALCSANLPTPLADPANDEQPSKFFSPYIWTGNGQNRNITIAADKKPSMTWIKERGATNNWNVWQHGYSDFDGDPDSFLETNSTGLINANQGANGTFTAAPSATALPLTVYGQVNANTDTYVGYVWSMNGGSNSTNTEGSVDSEVDANATVGQSLVTYTGTNNSWGNAITVGHGLDAAPDFIIAKQMTGNADEWAVFHSAVGNGGGSSAAHNSLVLNSTSALYTNQSYKGFGGTMPSATVFTVDGNNQNRSGSKIVAMCFTSKEGYSKFSSFEGNGNADGTFVYTGFRPSMIWAKSIDSTSDWFVFDNKRVGYNDDNNALSINTNAAETTTDMVDIVSNGFKFRIGTDPNVAETYIYCAWADVPFKYATAR